MSVLGSEQSPLYTRDFTQLYDIAVSEDASSGIEDNLLEKPAVGGTLYVHTTAAMDITIEVSPDGGQNFYSLNTKTTSGAEDIVFNINEVFDSIKITGSTPDTITAQLLALK